jgi:hypothetical protein
VNDTDFDELVGTGLAPAERRRLLRTHELLLAAGAPPELPPTLRVPPGTPPPAELVEFPRGYPRRRLAASVVAAAAAAAAVFGIGFLVANETEDAAFPIDFVLPMNGTAAAPEARASIEVGEIDDAGNWPMRMTVRNLPERPNRGRYELSLTRDGKIAASCGFFVMQGEKTVVYLNAPYRLRNYDTWVVTRAGSDRILLESPLEDEEDEPEA